MLRRDHAGLLASQLCCFYVNAIIVPKLIKNSHQASNKTLKTAFLYKLGASIAPGKETATDLKPSGLLKSTCLCVELSFSLLIVCFHQKWIKVSFLLLLFREKQPLFSVTAVQF